MLMELWKYAFWRKRLFFVNSWVLLFTPLPVSWHVFSVHETNTPTECNVGTTLWCSDVEMKSISFYQRSKLELILHFENTSDFSLKNNENWLITQKLINRSCSIVKQVTLWYQISHLTKHEANPAVSLGGKPEHTYCSGMDPECLSYEVLANIRH